MPGGNVAEEEEIARVAERVSQSIEGEQRQIGDEVPEDEPEALDEALDEPDEPDEPEAEPAHWADARKGGWKPKDEWDGDPEEWVPARAFLKNGELYDSIRRLKGDQNEIKQALKDATDLNRRLMQAQRKTTIDAKLQDRRAAIEAGDADAVDKIDREIYEFDRQLQDTPKEQPLPEPVQDWARSNAWFHEHPAAQQAAIAKFDQLQRQNPSDLAGNLEATTQYIYRRFPDLGPEPEPAPRKRPTAVETPSRRQASRKPTVRDLSPEQRQVHDRLVRTKTMSSQEYIESLAEIGEL